MVKNVLYFGSDLVSVMTLHSLMSRAKDHAFKLKVVCPPYTKPRTPLAELHKYLDQNNIPIQFTFGGKEEKPVIWKRLMESVAEN